MYHRNNYNDSILNNDLVVYIYVRLFFLISVNDKSKFVSFNMNIRRMEASATPWNHFRILKDISKQKDQTFLNLFLYISRFILAFR